MSAGGRLRVTLVLLGGLLLQLILLQDVRPQGVHPEVMLLLAVTAGIAGGPERGAVVGFLAGLAQDLFLQSPFGLSALVFALLAFAVGSVQSGILRATWWIPVVTALGASATGVALWALAASMLGETGLIGGRLLLVAALVAAMNAVLAPGAMWAMGWALRRGVPDYSYARS